MSRPYQSPRMIIRSHDPVRIRNRWIIAIVAGVLLLVGAFWLGNRYSNPPDFAKLRSSAISDVQSLKQAKAQLEIAAQEKANLTRGNQILQTANADLQQSLTTRDEEINRLRTDIGFYERLVGGSARQGLTLHEIRVRQATAERTWLFDITLLQNLKKGANINGTLVITIEGQSDGQLQTLGWKEVAAKNAEQPKFSFKYFQHVKGSFMLPLGFSPTRILLRANADTGEKLNQSVPWQDALKTGAQ